MDCPNCFETFRLVADYASHLQECRPSDVNTPVTETLLAGLNAATESLYIEFGVVEADEAAERQLVSAG